MDSIYLAPEELMVGSISDAKPGMALLLPRDKHEEAALVWSLATGSKAIVLDTSRGDLFRFLNVSNGSEWDGFLIPDIKIEIDITSAINPGPQSAPTGALIRKGSQLDVVGFSDKGTGRHNAQLLAGLSSVSDDKSVGFTRWSLVVGSGLNKRQILQVDAVRKCAWPVDSVVTT